MGNRSPVAEHADDDEPLDLDNPPFTLTAIDRQVLATRDEDFHRYSWLDLRTIIECNALEDLKRLPSDLHRYLRWSSKTRAAYGSITNFVVSQRLFWQPKDPNAPVTAQSFTYKSSIPFKDPRDYAVLVNDWPYGFEPGIAHLVVWSRTPIPVDSDRGDVTPESRRLIEEFVERHFVQSLAASGNCPTAQARERVQWFKNWVSLQSIRGLDHVHVLVRDVPDSILGQWTQRLDI